MRDRLLVLLDALTEDQRAVFVLYEIEQLTMNEIASAVGCPLQTAYSRLHAARARLEALARKEAS
jgi:RNA polymerase sigma-70 factor (ECF subfamily)